MPRLASPLGRSRREFQRHLLTGERRGAKLDELNARCRGTQTEQLLQRLSGV